MPAVERSWLGAGAPGALALGLLLASCGGPPVVEPASSGPIGRLVVDEARARDLISAYRQAQGQGEIRVDPALMSVARAQADAMASANQLSHTLAGSLPERLALSGVDRAAAVENVSAGYGTFEAALGGWRRSPAHNANLLFGPMNRMGIAAATAPQTRYKTFWALVMTD